MVAMPMGYKLVISRALGIHGIYCPQPLGGACPNFVEKTSVDGSETVKFVNVFYLEIFPY